MSWVDRDAFSPALGSAHTIDVPPSSRAGGVILVLRAHLGSASVASQIARDAVQVQAWTDAPVEGVTDGEWAAHTFTLPSTSPIKEKLQDEFTLDPPESVEPSQQHTLVARLKLRPLPAGQTTSQFSITYRLVYPDGGIGWLGSHGQDATCLLRRADPWLTVPPVDANCREEEDGMEVFGNVCMKERWAAWSISRSGVMFHAQDSDTSPDASILVLVPRPSDRTLALHQPIILHGARLRITPDARVLCAPGTRTRTRVYTAIAAAPELALAVPALGLRWLGIFQSNALVAIPPVDGAARLTAIPLLHAADVDTTLSIDLTACGFGDADSPAEGYAVYSPATRRVVGLDGHEAHLRVGPAGGSALVSVMHSLPVLDGASGADCAWRVAVLTPHALVLAAPESETGEHDDDTKEIDHDVHPAPIEASNNNGGIPWPEKHSPTATEPSEHDNNKRTPIAPATRKLVAYVIPLVWRTVALLLRTVLLRLFGLVGLQPPALLMSLLALSLPATRRETPYVSTSLDLSPEALRFEASTDTEREHEHDERPPRARTTSIATTESTVAPARAALHFTVPDGPLTLFAMPADSLSLEDKTRLKEAVRALEVMLDGTRLPLGRGEDAGAELPRGAMVLESRVALKGGALEVLGGAF